MTSLDDEFNKIIKSYEESIKSMKKQAKSSNRAFGGHIRSNKGKLTETIAQDLVKIAWRKLGGNDSDLDIIVAGAETTRPKKHKIFIKPEYIEKLRDLEIKQYLKDNPDKIKMFYEIKQDVAVYIKNEFVLSIEAKSYTENAMLKRILVDTMLLKEKFPKLCCALIQLESQLGGDYSELLKKPMGSGPTHALMSRFPDVTLNIITLLEGERNIKQPIHDEKFFKPLTRESLENASNMLADILTKYK